MVTKAGLTLYHTVYKCIFQITEGDLQLPRQSVPITTEVVSLNPAQARCTQYCEHYVIKFVSDLQ